MEEDVKMEALVSTEGPQYKAMSINKMKRVGSTEAAEVTCDMLLESMCELWRVNGSGKVAIEDDNH